MAITKFNGVRDLLNESLALVGMPMAELSIAELGIQDIENDTTCFQSAKSVFEFFGAEYVGFDASGRNDAIRLDLSKPVLDERYMVKFDIVTNFGASEHIEGGQFEVFANMHRFCRNGGLMVHAVPHVGYSANHGFWKYDLDWFSWLAERRSYDVLKLEKHDRSGKDIPLETCVYVHAIFRKVRRERFRTRKWRDPVREN